MNVMLRILLLAIGLVLVSCRDEETNREEARVQQEVARRVEAIRAEMKTDEIRWRTIRMATLSLLAGGSLVLLLGGFFDRPDKPASARLTGGESNMRRRVIDRPYDDPDDENYESPYHRR